MTSSSRWQAVPGLNQGASWRVFLVTAVVFLIGDIVLIWGGALVGATITTLLLAAMSFLAGYCYRQALLNGDDLPRLRALWLQEDDPRWKGNP